MSICGECEVSFAERIYEIRTLGGRRRLRGWIVFVDERTAREETNRLRYGRLKEATILRVHGAVSGQDLTQRKEGRQSPAFC